MATKDGSQWSTLHWQRQLETFGTNDDAISAQGPKGETDGICTHGEITDKGRETTLLLGQRLRTLYVDQLKYLPPIISSPDLVQLRATGMPRALESVQQTFWGLYPLPARTATFPPPPIITRTFQDETLYPNEPACKRFSQLVKQFADRCSARWNDSPEMHYLSRKLSRWMPDFQPVKLDSHPRLSGIMDHTNSTLAHGPETRLPAEFYEPKVREIIDKITVEEWFAGYSHSNEYRTLGIGALAGDIVARFISNVERSGNPAKSSMSAVGNDSSQGLENRGEKDPLISLSGCHDTTLAALLASLGAFKGEKWPPYTSHIAIELFHDTAPGNASVPPLTATSQTKTPTTGTLTSWLGLGQAKQVAATGIRRKPLSDLTDAEKQRLGGYFVRLRYNDRPVTIPGCKPASKHWRDDETFCTLEAFKGIVDKFTPKNWKEECLSNLDRKVREEIEVVGTAE